ncbi:hypothetical protein CQW23_29795 [Capsicum baccatum]|uniref:A20-type domain-containing protein n=1 Tax=Capsicum baccatum TaxID=33114 RepID=A0A2G2VC98_CAPBA|nr:hypothetical protein CQW23_29795 [Capsicum baccatum]
MFHAKKAFLFRPLQQVFTLRYLDVLTTQAENSHDLGKRLHSTITGDGNSGMDYFAWFGCIELWKVDMVVDLWKVDMISNPKRREVQSGLVLKVDSQFTPEMESSKETGCRAPEDTVLCINDCDFFGSVATMNMCSKFQKDMILLNQEHVKLAAASNKDGVRKSSSSDESKLALAGAAVASTELASQI